MQLWRISNFADLSGEGGLLAAGRWHSKGYRIIYLSDHPASALVEVLVNLEIDPDDFPESYQLLTVEVSDDVKYATIDLSQLSANWQGDQASTRAIGDDWLIANDRALLRVPSAVVPIASNWLLNPAHPDLSRMRITDVIRAPFDPRLFKVAQR
ncbi:MAG: RES family NAD+ phosphorylase [Deltaproteobacteria bacterium]|nr:RES family NAD+ phosphorylase [Deltaproteobacteria bacterium]